MLVRLRSKSFKLGFSSTWTENIQMFKLGLEKAEEFRDHIAKIRWITEKAREFQKLTTLKPWTVWIITNGGKLFSLVQFSSVTQLCLTLCNPMDHGTPDLPAHHQLPEFTQTHVHWVSDTIQPSHPLLSPSPAFNLSQHQVFSNELVLRIRWPKYCSFSFNISPSNEYSVLISFRMDWLDLLAVQQTLMSLLQYHSSKASILWHSAFFIV